MTDFDTEGNVTRIVDTTNMGICAQKMEFKIDKDGKLHDVKIVGGCSGNSKAVCVLLEGMDAEKVCEKLRTVKCGKKPVSCPLILAHFIDDSLTEKLERFSYSNK